MIIEDLSTLTAGQIEDIEQLTQRWMFQAVLDFGMEAYEIFRQSPDDVKEVAEDIEREILDRLSGFNIPQRIYGTVDYKKARYVVLPDMVIRQALFIDSKAEKSVRTATLQMSQTSLIVRQMRGGSATEETGLLPAVSTFQGKQYLTTTAIIHFYYEDIADCHHLRTATLCAVPNGRLQNLYNPTAADTIWLVGRNADSKGEDFRVRLGFDRLAKHKRWRVQVIRYNELTMTCSGNWIE